MGRFSSFPEQDDLRNTSKVSFQLCVNTLYVWTGALSDQEFGTKQLPPPRFASRVPALRLRSGDGGLGLPSRSVPSHPSEPDWRWHAPRDSKSGQKEERKFVCWLLFESRQSSRFSVLGVLCLFCWSASAAGSKGKYEKNCDVNYTDTSRKCLYCCSPQSSSIKQSYDILPNVLFRGQRKPRAFAELSNLGVVWYRFWGERECLFVEMHVVWTYFCFPVAVK